MSVDEKTQSSFSLDLLLSSIDEVVSKNLKHYIDDCRDKAPTHLYYIVIERVEASALAVLMELYDYNQTKVSKVLGISRGTMDKLIKKYQLITKKQLSKGARNQSEL